MANKPTYEELEQRLKDFENGTLAPKRSEEAIQLSAERFHRLFEQASDAFFIHDFNNGKIVDANESACKHLGKQQIDRPPYVVVGEIIRMTSVPKDLFG